MLHNKCLHTEFYYTPFSDTVNTKQDLFGKQRDFPNERTRWTV